MTIQQQDDDITGSVAETERFERMREAHRELYDLVGHLIWLVEAQLHADGGHITRDAKALLARIDGDTK